jgi:hypothetical protein
MPNSFAAVLLGRELNLAVVCIIHGSDINLYPHRSAASLWATKWRVSRVSAVSDHLKDNIFRLVGPRQIRSCEMARMPRFSAPSQSARRARSWDYR